MAWFPNFGSVLDSAGEIFINKVPGPILVLLNLNIWGQGWKSLLFKALQVILMHPVDGPE